MITIIIYAGLAVLLVIDIAIAVENKRNRKHNQLDRHDIDVQAAGLNKRRNDLDLWEHQIKGDAKSLRPQAYYEEVVIPAADKPSKKKARKSLASKFGYDVIDLIKIHEKKNEDGSATYWAELRFLHKEDQR